MNKHGRAGHRGDHRYHPITTPKDTSFFLTSSWIAKGYFISTAHCTWHEANRDRVSTRHDAELAELRLDSLDMPVSPLDVYCEHLPSNSFLCVSICNLGNQSRNQNFGPIQVQEFRRQLETIRTSSDIILEAITVDPSAIDDRIIVWLFSGDPRSRLSKLKDGRHAQVR